MSTTDGQPPHPPGAEYLAIQASPEFQDLRRTLRRFVFPMTAFFLICLDFSRGYGSARELG